MKRRQTLLGLLSAFLLPIVRATAADREPVVGLPCDGCEVVFDGLPSKLSSHARIAPINEPGEPLRLWGKVTDRRGHPQSGVIVYAYHTDKGGRYPPPVAPLGGSRTRHGRLRGWARTDTKGRYRFDTIRPGRYPGRDTPEHIHMHAIEPGRATYYIDDVLFRDDPKLTAQQVRELSQGRGGSGVTVPTESNGTWLVRRDIVLGLNIPGYPHSDLP